MGKFICRFDVLREGSEVRELPLDRESTEHALYFEWSSRVDAPVTFGMTREEFEGFYQEQYGASNMWEFEGRIMRADLKGTSAIDTTLNDLIAGNRAGPKEARLTREQLVRFVALCEEDPK